MSNVHPIFSKVLTPLPRDQRRDDQAIHPSEGEIIDNLTAAKGDIIKELTYSEITDSGRDPEGVLWAKMNLYLKRNGMSGEYKVEAAFNEYGVWKFGNLEPFIQAKR